MDLLRFLSRSSRQAPEESRPASPAGVETDGTNAHSSPSSPRRMDSEGYPSWLPERPPPPAPASTFQSSTAVLPADLPATPGPSSPPVVGGRKATPRSVRIVSLPDSTALGGEERRVPTDHTRVPSNNALHQRLWSRATGAAASPTLLNDPYAGRFIKPRFNSTALRLDYIRSESILVRTYFWVFRLFIFAHLPIQTYFDFNAVFMLIDVALYPTPQAPGVSGSGRSWSLAAAAYLFCWFTQIFGVFMIYELVYSFARRWRIRRPAIYPIYTSSPAFNFVCVSSYSKFCFLQNLRLAAWRSSMRDGLAETFWYYAQNLPTVSLLLPRAGLCLALLLTFWNPQAGGVAQADSGLGSRDGTFFHDDGSLTGYSKGVLVTNVAWIFWRALVLVYSWIGLWVLSEQCCAGICGPRYRWEEDDFEKAMASRKDFMDDDDKSELLWNWRECTKERIQELFDFCLITTKYGLTRASEAGSEDQRIAEQVMAAVGLGPHAHLTQAAKRSVLADDFFRRPPSEEPGPSRDAHIGPQKGAPISALPYPFVTKGTAQVSSDEERVPFPPSPSLPEEEKTSDEKATTNTDDDDLDEDDEDAEEERMAATTSPEPSSGHASGSMSSLGAPVNSRYPFQFRRPTRGTSGASSSSPGSHMTPHSSNGRSLQSRISQATSATNRESTDSHSPRSHYTTSESASVSPSSVGGIPMPPRHPNRPRAGTVPHSPAPSTPSPVPVNFPRGGNARRHARDRTRTDSGLPRNATQLPIGLEVDDSGDFESEEGGGDDIGLLSARTSPRSSGLSPRPSFVHRSRTTTGSSSSPHGSRSNSQSGSSSSGARSRVESARQRAQSFVASASRSSLELVRPRSRSMVRLEDEHHSSGHSRSGSGSGSGENWTFGHPAAWMRGSTDRRDQPSPVQEEARRRGPPSPVQEETRWRGQPSPVQERRESELREEAAEEEEEEMSDYGDDDDEEEMDMTTQIPAVVRASDSDTSLAASTVASRRTAHPDEDVPPVPQVFTPQRQPSDGSFSTHPDISTANPSFITAAPTVEGETNTDDSVRTVPSYMPMDAHFRAGPHHPGGPSWGPV
ncbi:hypothetical protein CYLTODRAFT_422421 [Cylindrobasidium torrendii FP15055 ss-10]|uniref:Proteophosphoglycan ppg4 n=1 Tax=Cylindrobasidium torrendii FP15055 ss-10 TaxID=1314674 RepID=A0A0D7BAJ2_9AGAR|nr:hypothetical protein CYLTODRAFT_422421 [Cylindrobasidium torrendii FP15055 ss-10]